jgi:hypothetical protein
MKLWTPQREHTFSWISVSWSLSIRSCPRSA